MAETYAIDEKILSVYTDWPILCIHCGSTDIFYSETMDDSRCQTCGEWQLEEEE